MRLKRLSILFVTGLFLLAPIAGEAQINVGNKLKKLKDKGSKTVDDKKDAGTPSVGLTKYDKALKEGEKYEAEGNYIEAYRSYSICLEEKAGDYSAKSRRSGIEDEAIEQYEANIAAAVENGDCETYKSTVTDMVGNIALSPMNRQNWEAKAANCEADMKASQEAAKIASDNAASAEKAAKLMGSLKKGEAYVSTGFVFNGPKEQIGIGEDMIFRVLFEKTMLEYSAEFGVPSRNFVYGYLTFSINGEKLQTVKYNFDSRMSGVWDYIDIPVSMDPSFIKQLQSNQSLVKTSQDVWLMQNAMNPEFNTSTYVQLAAPYAEGGDFTVGIEFGLGEKDGEKALGIIAKKEVKIKKDEKGYEAFLSRGPRYLQPLRAEEKGTTSTSGKNFGMEDINILVDLPQVPKYYNQKWCQDGVASDCDYPAGLFYSLLYLDGKPFKILNSKLDGETYTSAKQLIFTVLPKADDGMFGSFTNAEGRINQKGYSISTLVDLINGGKLGIGSHTFEMKLIAGNKVPDDMLLTKDQKTFINEKGMFAFVEKYPAIAEGKTTFNITKEGIANYQAKTNLDIAKSKVSKWATTESQLKANLRAKGDANIVVKDINIRWESWTVNYDAFKQPISRQTTVDIYYFNKSTNSYRYLYSQGIKEDYSGGKYGKVYWTSNVSRNMNLDSWGLEPGMNYPVPSNLTFK